MDIEKLIEQLNDVNENLIAVLCGIGQCAFGYLCDKDDCIVVRAATALSTLQAENEKLREELEQVKHALAMMWFAYVNSDKETPHSYETEVIEEAERLLGPWEECMPKYLRRGQKED